MTSSPDNVASLLTVLKFGLLPKERDAVLRAGKLPIDERSRKMFESGFSHINIQHALWATIRKQPDYAETFVRLDRLLNALVEEFQTTGGQEAAEIIEEGVILSPFIEMPQFMTGLTQLHHIVEGYKNIYLINDPKCTAAKDWLLFEHYQLFGKIKGVSRPGKGGPLYRFTLESTKLLGVKLNLTPAAFKMRLVRFLKEPVKTNITDPHFCMSIQRALNGYRQEIEKQRSVQGTIC
jgi:hypothetical protein